MKAIEMFEELVQDCRKLSAVIDKEVKAKDKTITLEILKDYLDKTTVEGELLVLPILFYDVPAYDKMKVAVFVTEYLCWVKSQALQAFKENINPRTGEIFNMADRIHVKFRNYIFNELE